LAGIDNDRDINIPISNNLKLILLLFPKIDPLHNKGINAYDILPAPPDITTLIDVDISYYKDINILKHKKLTK
jgi:hypothetical protein